MASIGKVEHTPEGRIRVRFGDLEEGQVCSVGRREGELVDGREDTGVGDGPLERAGCLAAHNARRVTVTGIGSSLSLGIPCERREELGNTEVALGRRREQIVFGVKVSVKVRI